MEDKNTKVNIRHYIGKIAHNEAAVLAVALLISVPIGGAIGYSINQAIDQTPDNVGTENQAIEYFRLTDAIQELNEQQRQLEIATLQSQMLKLEETPNPDAIQQQNDKVSEMKRSFDLNSYSLLADFLTHGDLNKEADVSEAQIMELTKLFENNIAPVTDFGLKTMTTARASNLDECRIDTHSSNNITQDFNAINSCIDDEVKSTSDATVLPAMLSFLVAFGGTLFGSVPLKDWKNEPTRIERTKRRKNKFTNY